jgi:DNA replication regulator DPB11
MGALCFFDLTVQVTHLVVGDVATAKYNYVAKERPDIKVVLPEFIEAARAAWLTGDEVDIQELEEKYRAPTLYGLHICVTGYTDREY